MSIGDLAATRPYAIEVFEEYGVDYSCRGKRCLADACDAAGLEVDFIVRELEDRATKPRIETTNWQERPVRALIRHLVAEHHVSSKTAIIRLLRDVATLRDCGAGNGTIKQIEMILTRLGDLLARHMASEETQLFPFIARLEAALDTGADPPAASDTLANRVLVEYIEHDQIAERVTKLRELLGNITVPDESVACKDFLRDVRRFDRAVNRHMHLENNILLPRAVELENVLKHRLLHSV